MLTQNIDLRNFPHFTIYIQVTIIMDKEQESIAERMYSYLQILAI